MTVLGSLSLLWSSRACLATRWYVTATGEINGEEFAYLSRAKARRSRAARVGRGRVEILVILESGWLHRPSRLVMTRA